MRNLTLDLLGARVFAKDVSYVELLDPLLLYGVERSKEVEAGGVLLYLLQSSQPSLTAGQLPL